MQGALINFASYALLVCQLPDSSALKVSVAELVESKMGSAEKRIDLATNCAIALA